MNPRDDIFYVGTKIILSNRQNQILLLQMSKPDEIFWELPGGRMQVGETQQEALLREIKEETGITDIGELQHLGIHISAYRVPAYSTTAGIIFSFYSGQTNQNTVILSGDHTDYAWVTKENVLPMLNDDAYGPKLIEYLKI